MGLIGILGVLAVITIAISLFYTITVARSQKKLQGEFDTPVDKRVQDHPYIRNPVFIAIFICFVIFFIIIAYMAGAY